VYEIHQWSMLPYFQYLIVWLMCRRPRPSQYHGKFTICVCFGCSTAFASIAVMLRATAPHAYCVCAATLHYVGCWLTKVPLPTHTQAVYGGDSPSCFAHREHYMLLSLITNGRFAYLRHCPVPAALQRAHTSVCAFMLRLRVTNMDHMHARAQ
jgi:hypothetical protein